MGIPVADTAFGKRDLRNRENPGQGANINFKFRLIPIMLLGEKLANLPL
jgi:hypothetical protein